MALNNILPQYQAEERSAQVNVHPVPMPNHMDLAGRMLSQAGNDIQKATFGLALDMKRRKDALQAKEDDLAVSQALNGFAEEMTKLQTELSHKIGAEAKGNTKTLEDAWPQAARRHAANLSLNGTREFNIRIGQMFPTYWKSTNNHEWEQTTQANIQAKTTTLNNEISLVSMNGGTLERVEGAAKDLFVAQYGTLDEGSEMWKNFRQEMFDRAISSCVEYRANNGNILRASEYFNDHQNELSNGMRAKLQTMLHDSQNNEIQIRRANAWLAEANAQDSVKSLNGRYGSEGRDLFIAKKMQELASSTDPNDKLALQYFKQAVDVDSAVKAANLTADMAEHTSKLKLDDSYGSLLSNISYFDFMLPMLGDSLLKDRLTVMHNNMKEEEKRQKAAMDREAKAKTAEEKEEARELAAIEKAEYTAWEKDEVRKAMAGLFIAGAARSDHKVELEFEREDGSKYMRSFDLSNEKERKDFFAEMDWGSSRENRCLTDQNKRLITAIATGQIPSEEHNRACYDIAQYMKNLTDDPWDQSSVVVLMPEYVDEYMMKVAEFTKGGQNNTKPVTDALELWFTKRLLEKRDVADLKYWFGWFRSNYEDGKWFFKDAVGSKGKVNLSRAFSLWNSRSRNPKTITEEEQALSDISVVVYGGARKTVGKQDVSAKKDANAEANWENM